MGFITSKRSSQLVKPLPAIKTSSRKDYPSSKLDYLPRCQHKNDDFVLEEIELEKQLKLAEEMSNGSDCTWLSFDCDSLSLLVPDRSGDYWELSSTKVSQNDNLHQSNLSDAAEGKILKERHSLKNPAVSSYTKSLIKELVAYGNSCIDDSSFSISKRDKKSIWISTLDINLEGSKSVQQKEDEVGFSNSDFSTPSHSSKSNSHSESESEEPLFWPYHENSYKTTESGNNCLSISPPKIQRTIMSKGIHRLKAAEGKLRKCSSMPASRKSMPKPESTKLLKKSPTLSKAKNSPAKGSQNYTISPLQLTKTSPQASSKLVRCTGSTKARHSSTKKETHRVKLKSQTLKLEEVPKKHLLEFEVSHLEEFLVKGVTIEKIIGLDEFDGREGLSAEFCGDFHLIS